jgi:hypothetical protein
MNPLERDDGRLLPARGGRPGGLPVAPPVSARELPRLPRPVGAGRVIGGVILAVAGQALVGGLLLGALHAFSTSATPDSLFLVDLLVMLGELVLIVGCVGGGCWLAITRDRGFGGGLILGWVIGVTAVAAGLALLLI